MDIKNLMQQMHDASSEQEKALVVEKIKSGFYLLSDSEKKEVRESFVDGLDVKLKEANNLIHKIDVALEISEISKYVSLSRIASDYFGKSKEWLYQRIKGYNVNGKKAEFSDDEIKKLSVAFEDISRMAHETALKFA
jgi:predicted transcriptional regulator